MQVFSEEWVQKIRRRYERLPDYQRPLIYLVATSDKFQTVRDEVEQWVGELPDDEQFKVIPRLRSSRRFTQTYHELVVGNILREFGYQAEYEKALNGLTPDWYVHPSSKRTPAFIVEVLDVNVSDTTNSEQRQIRALLGRLRSIPVGVVLGIELYRAKVTLDQKRNKMIAARIQQWLTDDVPPVGAQLSIDGIVFKIIHRDISYPSVRALATAGMFWVNPKALRDSLETKVHRYKDLATQASIPLVIGVVADPQTGLDADDLWDVLFGQEVYEVTFEESTGAIVEGRPIRKANGLFRKASPALSATIWLWGASGEWQIRAVYNPNALNPLPVNAFG